MQYNSFNTQATFFQKLMNFDYILLICILLLGLISALSMYSTDGASDLISAVFLKKGMHTRAAVSVNSLPLGVAVEIEAIFEIN